jgi:hypothetical protein
MATPTHTVSRPARIVGWVLTLLPIPLLLMAVVMNIIQPAAAVENTTKLGYSQGVMLPLGIVLLSSIILYLVPQTAVLGAILLTGYLGGAVDVHVRNGDPLPQILFPALFGVVLWLGLYLRDPRLRALTPIRSIPRQDQTGSASEA